MAKKLEELKNKLNQCLLFRLLNLIFFKLLLTVGYE